jgi:predicted nucleic acid-binding protein
VIYLDSSAIVKLARQEAETHALRAWIGEEQQPACTSALARTETARTLQRSDPASLPILRAVLATLHQAPVSDALLDAAAALPGANLRSLDAIHLATAEAFASLRWFVAYDNRLLDAARLRGLPAIAPD